jgi:hypothetical protein
MTQVTKANITKLDQFEVKQKVRSTDYGHLGTIREFGYLNDNTLNSDWLKCQSQPWSEEEKNSIVAVLDVLPRGSAIVPVNRLETV